MYTHKYFYIHTVLFGEKSSSFFFTQKLSDSTLEFLLLFYFSFLVRIIVQTYFNSFMPSLHKAPHTPHRYPTQIYPQTWLKSLCVGTWGKIESSYKILRIFLSLPNFLFKCLSWLSFFHSMMSVARGENESGGWWWWWKWWQGGVYICEEQPAMHISLAGLESNPCQ